jgi:hypothetical protein
MPAGREREEWSSIALSRPEPGEELPTNASNRYEDALARVEELRRRLREAGEGLGDDEQGASDSSSRDDSLEQAPEPATVELPGLERPADETPTPEPTLGQPTVERPAVPPWEEEPAMPEATVGQPTVERPTVQPWEEEPPTVEHPTLERPALEPPAREPSILEPRVQPPAETTMAAPRAGEPRLEAPAPETSPPLGFGSARVRSPVQLPALTSFRWGWAVVAVSSLVLLVVVVSALLPVGRGAIVPNEESPADGGAVQPRAEVPPAEPAPQGERTREAGSPWANKRHVNERAGYSFRYPASWRLQDRGEVSTVTSPDGRIVVSFALGPLGPPGAAYESFLDLIESSYRRVQLGRRQSIATTDGSSLLVSGSATNSSGTRVRFRALLMALGEDRPAIGAIAATDSRDSLDPRLTEVLSSVRPV